MSDELAVALRAMGNPTRLRILRRLLQGEAAVAALERELELRQPALSQHLAELREAGLVVSKRASKSVIYTLTETARGRLRGLLTEPAPPPADTRRAHLGAMFARVATRD